MPNKVDLREGKLLSSIEDQGELGSCTAQALVGSLEFLEKYQNLEMQFIDLSRLFLYYNEREIEGSVDYDSGAYLRDGIKSLAKQGICSERSWPYIIEDFAKKPTENTYKEASPNIITIYSRLDTLEDMKNCLASGFPFVFGMEVYESFITNEVAKTGIVPLPEWNESFLGGHAVCAVGYDEFTQRFLVRNSWGSDWGQEGYFTIPYEYLIYFAADFWTIRKNAGFIFDIDIEDDENVITNKKENNFIDSLKKFFKNIWKFIKSLF